MEAIIIITSLVVLTGFVKVFSNHKNDFPGNQLDETSNLFIVPSIIDNIKQGRLLWQFETDKKDESYVADKFESSINECVTDEEINNDFEEQTIEEEHQLNKKVIVYKSVTKRMTLVKVY